MTISVWPTVPSRVFMSSDTFLLYWRGADLCTSSIRWSGKDHPWEETVKGISLSLLGYRLWVKPSAVSEQSMEIFTC